MLLTTQSFAAKFIKDLKDQAVKKLLLAILIIKKQKIQIITQ
jgi:hypothetical protein